MLAQNINAKYTWLVLSIPQKRDNKQKIPTPKSPNERPCIKSHA